MDRLSDGQVFLDGEEISTYHKKKLTSYRRYDIGFVFQFYNLVQNLTALENVENDIRNYFITSFPLKQYLQSLLPPSPEPRREAYSGFWSLLPP